MKRVWKRMAGMLLTAVLLVNMGMTVSAKGVSYSDLSAYSQTLLEGYVESSTLYDLIDKLEKYIETGNFPFGAIGSPSDLSVEEARILLEYINNGDSSDDSDEKKESTKTVDEKIQNEAVREIDRALQAGSATAVFDGRIYGINTLSRDLMGEINRRGIDMVFKYTYNGYYYEITIPAGQAPIDPNVPWCGPMYLYGLFADTAVVTPVA